jgi:hypothetical protein
MSKTSIIKQNQTSNDIYPDKSNIISENKNTFEHKFIDSNLSLSFESYFSSNDILSKKNDIKDNYTMESDFIEEKKEDEDSELLTIIDDLNKNIEINMKEIENKNYIECQEEILNILRKPLTSENDRYNISPFKPLLKPKKISMVGKVFYNDYIDNIDYINTSDSSTINNM